MSNVSELEGPPPGPGLTTATFSVPATEMSSAEICAVTCWAFTNVVCRALPFHCTDEPDIKFEPSTLNVNADPPRVAVLGEIFEMAGTGLDTGEPPPPQPKLPTTSMASEIISARIARRVRSIENPLWLCPIKFARTNLSNHSRSSRHRSLAYQDRDMASVTIGYKGLVYINLMPMLDPLRSDPTSKICCAGSGCRSKASEVRLLRTMNYGLTGKPPNAPKPRCCRSRSRACSGSATFTLEWLSCPSPVGIARKATKSPVL